MSQSSLVSSTITTAILLLIALPLLGFGCRNLWNALASLRWPVAEGRIRTSEVREFVSGTASDRNRTRNYTPSVIFEYTVDGRKYCGDTVYRGQAAGSADASEAELVHGRYPEGAKVKVHYDPATPANAVLEPGIEADVFWLPGLGLVFLLPCLLYWVPYWRYGQRYEWPYLLGELLAVGICVGGIAACASGFQNFRLGWESKAWPTVPGVIVGSPFEIGNRSPSLTYEYEVTGRKYEGGLLQFGGLPISNYSNDEEFARRYAVRNTVRVAYSPEVPSLAVLEPGIHSDAWWIPTIGMVMLLAGLALGTFAIPRMTRMDFIQRLPIEQEWPRK